MTELPLACQALPEDRQQALQAFYQRCFQINWMHGDGDREKTSLSLKKYLKHLQYFGVYESDTPQWLEDHKAANLAHQASAKRATLDESRDLALRSAQSSAEMAGRLEALNAVCADVRQRVLCQEHLFFSPQNCANAADDASLAVTWVIVEDLQLEPSPFAPLLEIWAEGFWPIGPLAGKFVLLSPSASDLALRAQAIAAAQNAAASEEGSGPNGSLEIQLNWSVEQSSVDHAQAGVASHGMLSSYSSEFGHLDVNALASANPRETMQLFASQSSTSGTAAVVPPAGAAHPGVAAPLVTRGAEGVVVQSPSVAQNPAVVQSPTAATIDPNFQMAAQQPVRGTHDQAQASPVNQAVIQTQLSMPQAQGLPPQSPPPQAIAVQAVMPQVQMPAPQVAAPQTQLGGGYAMMPPAQASSPHIAAHPTPPMVVSTSSQASMNMAVQQYNGASRHHMSSPQASMSLDASLDDIVEVPRSSRGGGKGIWIVLLLCIGGGIGGWWYLTQSPSALFGQASALLDEKKFASAEEVLKRLLTGHADYPQAQRMMGDVLWHTKREKEAIKAYQRAVAFQNNDGLAQRNLGILLKRHQQLTESAIALRRATQLLAKDPFVWLNLSIVLDKQKRYEEASLHARKAIQLFQAVGEKPAAREGLAASWNSLGAILLHQAQVVIEKLAGNPASAMTIRQLEHAEKAFRQAITVQRGHPLYQRNLGDVLVWLAELSDGDADSQQKKIANASEAYGLAARASGERPALENNRALLLLRAEQHPEALKLLQNAVAQLSSLRRMNASDEQTKQAYFRALYNFAFALEKNKQEIRAISVYQRYVRRATEDPHGYERLAPLLVQVRQKKEAGKVYFRLAQIYLGLGHREHARRAYRKVLRLRPDRGLVRKARQMIKRLR